MFKANRAGMNPKGRWIDDLHWHTDLQLTLVTKGSAVIQVNSDKYDFNAGEAVFINSSTMHSVADLSEDGEYVSFNFPYKVLSFFQGSLMEQNYVLPYTAYGRMPMVEIRPTGEWQCKALEILKELEKIFSDTPKGKEYYVAIKLAELWYYIVDNYDKDSEVQPSKTLHSQLRLQEMLKFIYLNYDQDISLNNITYYASVSKAEGSRIFRELLHTSPYSFLKEYRINKSIELLYSDMPIAEVASKVGFSSQSNFTAAFKQTMGCTPKQFRQKGTKGDENG
ncbi:MAG: AraC family transcriptional regulator [Clostridiales bacterium]|nr:AraC family transcriptional regulator [Clostridiales bacterium]